MGRGPRAWTVMVGLVGAVAAGCGDADGCGAEDDAGCETPLAGETPFGAILQADVAYRVEGQDAPIERTTRLEVYFPEGRVPGAPVLLAGSGAYLGALSTTRAVLDARGEAQVQWSGKAGVEDLYVEGTLRAPDQGLDATLHRNLAVAGSDVAVDGEAAAWLCPAGPTPAPVLTARGCTGPTSALELTPNVPLAPDTVTAAVDGVATEVAVAADGTVQVAPAGAFPPNQELDLTVSALDVIGRPFTLEAPPELLRTDGVITDLTFEARPPEGSVAGCAPFHVRDGALHAGGPDSGPFDLLLALPHPGGETQLTAHLTWESGCDAIRLDAVGPDGSVAGASVDLASGTEETVTFSLFAGRPLWLAVRVSAERAEPQWGQGPSCVVSLHELTLE